MFLHIIKNLASKKRLKFLGYSPSRSGRGITQERVGTKLGELEGTNFFGINLARSEVELHEHINLGGGDGSIGTLVLTLDE